MLKPILTLLFGGFLLGSVHAQTTFAEVILTHFNQTLFTPTGSVTLDDRDIDLHFRIDTDTDAVGGFDLDVSGLRNGERTVTTYYYTMTVSIRGVPYTGPRTLYCTPVAFESQCFEPNGFEQAFAMLTTGGGDPRQHNPFIDVIGEERSLFVSTDVPMQRQESGQVSASVSTSDESNVTVGTFQLRVYLNAFAAPVPEVSTRVSLLAGIALLATALTWRRRRALRAVSCS
ncbi:MAG TPA: hypothetical protein VF169_24180 [Albitalea sp.]|uniref:hypothetical protein n=1 Tax=Piscinibacter sp. TaxID=1903157 RepID=UPI002ED35753